MPRGTLVSRKQIVDVNELLKEQLRQHPDAPEYFIYNDGWSDEEIAKQVGVAHGSVAKIRLELYGKLANTESLPFVFRTVKKTIESLRTENNLLKVRLTNLEERHNKLCAILSLNRVADVRHLQSGQPTNGIPVNSVDATQKS